jgi:DUF1680 family protein
VACCPANLSRLMAQLPGLVYAQRRAELFVNLFVGSTAHATIGGAGVRVTQQTAYPWDGRITITMDPDRPIDLTLAVRIPGWSRGQAVPSDLYRFLDLPGAASGESRTRAPGLTVNGTPVRLTLNKGYAEISRRWRKGDIVRLDLPMPIRRVLANEAVAEDRGKAAIERGPIVYCVEAVDNGGHVSGVRAPLDARWAHQFRASLLDGVDVITGAHLVAVPYYAWNNRGRGEMAVWLPYR